MQNEIMHKNVSGLSGKRPRPISSNEQDVKSMFSWKGEINSSCPLSGNTGLIVGRLHSLVLHTTGCKTASTKLEPLVRFRN